MNFRDFKTGYYDAYCYTTKKHPGYIISDNHPADIEASWTAVDIAAHAANNIKSMEPDPTRLKQQRRLQPSDIYAVIVENNIKSDLKLCALASKLKEERKAPSFLIMFLIRMRKGGIHPFKLLGKWKTLLLN